MFKNIFFGLFRKTIYFLSRMVTPFIEEDSVIIGGYKARFLLGNNEYLLNYLTKISTGFDYYFYTKDKSEYNKLKNKYKGKIIYAYHFKTLIKLLKSKVIIVTSGPDDLSPYPFFYRKIIINLWHGIPMKNIGYKSVKNISKSFVQFAKSIDFYTVSSDNDKEIIKQAFKLNNNKIRITGLQINDYIKLPHTKILNSNPLLIKNKIILYAPTFREKGMQEKKISELIPLAKLNDMLERYDAFFLYRSHFNTTDKEEMTKYPRIKSASSSEFPSAQSLLFYTDILISDYSGIFFDFLLLDNPVIFYNYDIEEYKKSRGLIMNYEENTPGPKVQNQKDLLFAIEKYLLNPELDSEFRKKIKNRFHKYTDGKACERTYQLIKEIL